MIETRPPRPVLSGDPEGPWQGSIRGVPVSIMNMYKMHDKSHNDQAVASSRPTPTGQA